MYPLKTCPLVIIVCSCLAISPARAASDVQEVLVTGVKERLYEAGMLKDTIEKTEVISAQSIEQAQAANITQAIGKSPGVRVNNECSTCGVKRVMLNGLRGEHTTILVDGLPTHSMVSSFYGLDATSAAGIERIEIARGAGASLIAPEAIGGTINLITKEAHENALAVDLAGGQNAYQKMSAVGTLMTNDDTTGITAIAQKDGRDQVDGDNNGLSENPLLKNQSFTLRVSQEIGARDNLTLRGNHTRSDIFGGPMNTSLNAVKKDYLEDPEYSSEHFFRDDDVRNTYIGKPWETAEGINTSRNELAGSWLHESNAKLNFTLAASLAQHQQKSFYEGFIYNADNDVRYVDGRVRYALSDNHLLTVGVHNRSETLRSHTNSSSENYTSDSFNYTSSGIYLQDTWTATNTLQIALALRADKLIADFIDPKKPGEEINQTLLSPRLDMRLTHSEAWNSRLSLGQGYRVPLSFFESDHGLLDSGQGFNINIDQLERSNSVNYSLNFDHDQFSATSSIAYTQVKHLAQLSSDENNIPTLTQLSDAVHVLDYDIALTYKLNPQISFSGVAETYDYSTAFKHAFSVAPIEQRLNLTADFDLGQWETYISAVWIGARNLTDYATPTEATFDLNGNLFKNTQAPSYWTIDVQIAYSINQQFKLYLGGNNLLNYTQVHDEQTPLFYQAGEYDVNQVYGPLRGREVYLGVKCIF